MRCKKCKKEMDIFIGGKSGTFVPISTRYLCLKCKLQFRSISDESNDDYNKYIWEKIEIK